MEYAVVDGERLVFIGLEGGHIMLYTIAEDFNHIKLKTTLPGEPWRDSARVLTPL